MLFFEKDYKTILKDNGLELKKFPHLQDIESLCRIAVNSEPSALESVSERLKNSVDFVIPVLEKAGAALEYVSNNLKNNFEVVLTAVQNSCISIIFASDEKQMDPTIFRAAYYGGFRSFISYKYVDYLRQINNYKTADWIEKLCNHPFLIDYLLTAENSCEFSIPLVPA